MPPTTPQATPEPVPQKPSENTEGARIVHTYQDDLALAMNATDATVVQELLHTAREQEAAEKEAVVVHRQRGWYTAGGIILLLLAIGAGVYGVYYYRHLTVDVAPAPSVGVFQSTTPVVVDETLVADAMTRLTTADTIAEGKPLLVPIVTSSGAALSTPETLKYLNLNLSEPFQAALSLARLGVYNNGTSVSPFLIFSVPNAEIASKEFLIAEPKLLDMIAPLFGINLQNPANEVAPGFTSTYMYNLPVRTLKSTNIDTNTETIILYYGFATDHTIVLATNPTILKSVYDTIIRQR